MDMVEMMLQHLHDFSEPYAHDQGFHFHPPEDHFYANNNNNNIRNTMPLADLIDNNNPPTSMPCWSSSTISFSNNNNPTVLQQQPTTTCEGDNKKNSMAVMREMIFRIAAMQPIHIDPESVKAPKRRNVKISKDPQSVAARHRRERISERIRILQRLVPGGTKMDTASMLDEAIHYVKFLKTQVQSLEQRASSATQIEIGFPVRSAPTPYFPHMEMHHRYD